jgi:glycosyltransferase involved in cell wall biosynthesis
VQNSISVLLPVKDAQATLIDSVHEVLDAVADTNQPFEVLIIDDGSTDATSEVADELSHHYPQVRMVRHGTALGEQAAIRTGLHSSRGDMVVLRDEKGGFRLIERRAPPLPKAAASHPRRPNYLQRLKDFTLGE